MGRIFFLIFILLSGFAEAKRFRLIDGKTAYQIMRVRPTADQFEIDEAYSKAPARSFALSYIENLNLAYQYLRTPDSRERYDAWLDITSALQEVLNQPLSVRRQAILDQVAARVAHQAGELTKRHPGRLERSLIDRGQLMIALQGNLSEEKRLSPRELYKMVLDVALHPGRAYGPSHRLSLAGGAIEELEQRKALLDEGDLAIFGLRRIERLIKSHAAEDGPIAPVARALLEIRGNPNCNEQLLPEGIIF